MEFLAKVNAEGKAFVKFLNELVDPPVGSHDFIPIVSLDTGQLTSSKSYKYDYKDFEIVQNYKGKSTTLSTHLDNNTQPLHAIKIYKETIVRFTVEKGNSTANDDDGKIAIKPNGVTILTKDIEGIEYGHAIALKIDANNITDDAYIDFYASDDDGGLTEIHCGRVAVKKLETFLILYGSGWLSPTAGDSHHTGDSFKLIAEARNKINKKSHPDRDYKIFYCPTDKEFFEHIKNSKNIKRLDVYSHAWAGGLNLGGFTDSRIIDGANYDGGTMDWDLDSNQEFRRLRSIEVTSLESKSFSNNTEVYFWGCNAGGQLTSSGVHVAQNSPLISDPKITFAQKFAKAIGKGNVYALVGKGTGAGSMFKTDNNKKTVFDDGEMLPANIALNHGNKNTIKIDAKKHMKKFPL